MLTYEGQWGSGAAGGYGVCAIRFQDVRVSTYSGDWQDNAHHGRGTHIEVDGFGKVQINESVVFGLAIRYLLWCCW